MNKINRLLYFVILSLQTLSLAHNNLYADTILFTDLTTWESSVFMEEVFLTTQANIELAEEVPSPVINHQTYGDTWTFNAASTGLGFSFQVMATMNDDNPGLSWLDPYNPGVGEFGNSIFPTGGDNDDWGLDLLGNSRMRYFGFEIRGNEQFAGETISLLSHNGSVIDIIDLTDLFPEYGEPGYTGYQFIGLFSNIPFSVVRFDEANEANGDDIGVADFRFGHVTPVPEPATLILLSTGLLGLAGASRRKFKR